MFLSSVVALWCGLAVIAIAQELGDMPDPVESLRGKWPLVSAERAGKRTDRKQADPFILTITGNVISNNRFPDQHNRFRVDVSRKPRHIDQFLPVLKKWQRGIYEINENKLRICWVSGDNPRPGTFATNQDDSRLLQEFRIHTDQD